MSNDSNECQHTFSNKKITYDVAMLDEVRLHSLQFDVQFKTSTGYFLNIYISAALKVHTLWKQIMVFASVSAPFYLDQQQDASIRQSCPSLWINQR